MSRSRRLPSDAYAPRGRGNAPDSARRRKTHPGSSARDICPIKVSHSSSLAPLTNRPIACMANSPADMLWSAASVATRAVSGRSSRASSVSLTKASSSKRAITSPSSMISLRSIDPHGAGIRKIDAFDARGAGEARNVLRQRPPSHALLQIFGDAVRHQLERQLAALVLAIQPDDVETVAGRDRLRADRPGLERRQRLLEFGRGLAGRDLTEVAALRSRRAVRVRPRQVGKLLGMLAQDGEGGLRGCTRLRITRRIGLARGEQDMGRFVDVG